MKTHWKKLTNPNYLGSYSIEPGETLTVKLNKVVKEMVTGADSKKEECIVAYLQDQKPMILNKTNCKSIAKIYDSPFIEDWTGKNIILYVAKIKAFGDIVEALRVKEQLPELPELTPEHEKWQGAKKSITDKTYTIAQLKKHFKISPENEKLLQM
jgi:hypothetical protein